MSKTQKAVLALIVANTIWGAASPIFKWSLTDISPFALAFLRFGLASLILFPFCYKNLKIKPKHVILLILIAVFGISINIAFFFLGLKKTDSINAPIIASSGPIFLIFLGALFLKDKVKLKTIGGGLLGLLGVLIIVLIPVIDKGIDGSVTGNLFFIFAMLGSVISAILLKKIAKYYDPIVINFWSFVIGTVTFAPLLLNEINEHKFVLHTGLPVFAGILFGAFFASALAYNLHTWAIKLMPIEDVGLFTYMDPVIAVIIAAPLVHEYPTPAFFAGAFLVFLGIYIAEGRLHYHPVHKLIKRGRR